MKKIFLFFLIMLLSGCAIKYDLTINNDLGVEEDIKVMELKSTLNKYVVSVEDFINQSLNYYKSDDKYKIYNIIDDSKDGYAIGNAYNNYINIEDYCNNSVAKDSFFKECNCEQDGNLVTITMEAVDFNEYLFSSELEESIIKNAELNIFLPYKVISSNSNSNKDNIYTWEYGLDNYKNDVVIVFDTSKIYRDTNYSIFILGGIILIMIVGGIYIYNKYQQNSKY